jgi:hypothetical protein
MQAFRVNTPAQTRGEKKEKKKRGGHSLQQKSFNLGN